MRYAADMTATPPSMREAPPACATAPPLRDAVHAAAAIDADAIYYFSFFRHAFFFDIFMPPPFDFRRHF